MGKAAPCLSHGAHSAEGQPRSRCAAGGCVSALRSSASVLHAHRVTLPQEGPDTNWNYDYFKSPQIISFPFGAGGMPRGYSQRCCVRPLVLGCREGWREAGTGALGCRDLGFWDAGRQGPGMLRCWGRDAGTWDAGTPAFWDAVMQGFRMPGCRNLGFWDAGTQDFRMQGLGMQGGSEEGTRDFRMQGPSISGCCDAGTWDFGMQGPGMQGSRDAELQGGRDPRF